MTQYRLILESGPKRKKTMVHVLDLLGCVITGPTTPVALQYTAAGIADFRHFLRAHGAAAPDDDITMEVVLHITEGAWVGNGDPTIRFPDDLAALPRDERAALIERMEWMRGDLLALARQIATADLVARSEAGGRSIRSILEHICAAEYSYVRSFGKLPGIAGPGVLERMDHAELLEWMEVLLTAETTLLRDLTDEQMTEALSGRAHAPTPRQRLRRVLEHQWEHLQEIRQRLAAHE